MSEFPADDTGVQKPRTTREIIDGMPTPTTRGGVFALFAAIEAEAVEEGRSTPEESRERLVETFRPPAGEAE